MGDMEMNVLLNMKVGKGNLRYGLKTNRANLNTLS